MILLIFSFNNKSLGQEKGELVKEERNISISSANSSINEGQNNKISPIETWEQLSPEASMVNLYTGTVGTFVTLINYEHPDFSYPISLVYSSNGFKPGESGEGVGMGWGLDVGGIITREIKGMPDNISSYHRYLNEPIKLYSGHYFGVINPNEKTSVIPDLNNGHYMWSLKTTKNEFYERAPDIFHFRFGEHSGSFTIETNIKVFNSNLPSGEYKIDVSNIVNREGSSGKSEITIITGDGTTYLFEARKENDAFYDGLDFQGYYKKIGYNVVWVLKSIKSNLGRTITFEYIDVPEEDFTKLDIRRNLEVKRYLSNTDYPIRLRDLKNDIHIRSAPKVSKIKLPGSTVTFNYNSRGQLSEINCNEPQQTINLDYIYKGKYPLLKYIKFNSGEKYSFDYYDEDVAFSEIREVNKIDHWGYYNGINSSTQVPDELLGTSNIFPEFELFSDKRPVFEKARMFTLKKITYPVGGYTTFKYEPHYYNKQVFLNINAMNFEAILGALNTTKEAGGVRIKRITSHYSLQDSIWTEYLYGDDTNCGHLLYLPSYKKTARVKRYCVSHNDGVNSFNLTETTNVDLKNPFTGYYMEYPCVTVVKSDGSFIKNTFTTFQDFPDKYNFVYPYRVEQLGLIVPDCWLMHRGFGSFECYSSSCTYNYGHYDRGWNFIVDNEVKRWVEPMSYHWRRGRITKKELFDNTGKLVSEERTNYEYSDVATGVVGLENSLWCCLPYGVLRNRIVSIEQNRIDHFENGSVNLTSQSIFNDKEQLKEKSFTKSDGSIYSINYLYLTDINASDRTEIQKEMYKRNLLSIPLKSFESVFYPNSNTKKTIKGERYDFKIHERSISKLIVLEEIKTTNFESPISFCGFNFDQYLNSGIKFTYNNNGTIQTIIDLNGIVTTLLWGYNYREVVAKIVNASYEQITSILGDDFPVIIANAIPNESQISTLKSLRTLFPEAEVTIYIYRPNVGLLSVTDPSGRSIYYEYDEFHRLSKIKDDKGNLIESYDYSPN